MSVFEYSLIKYLPSPTAWKRFLAKTGWSMVLVLEMRGLGTTLGWEDGHGASMLQKFETRTAKATGFGLGPTTQLLKLLGLMTGQLSRYVVGRLGWTFLTKLSFGRKAEQLSHARSAMCRRNVLLIIRIKVNKMLENILQEQRFAYMLNGKIQRYYTHKLQSRIWCTNRDLCMLQTKCKLFLCPFLLSSS